MSKQKAPPVCCEYSQPATWMRYTQFCGNHPFCEECAHKEKDFGKEDPSYFFWEKLDENQTGICE